MRTVVTGGCGFIGSHLVQALLEQGHDVTVIDNMVNGKAENLAAVPHRERLNIVVDDVSKPGPWEALFKGADWVVHLAALINIVESINEPRRYLDVNVGGTFNVLEAARAHAVKRFVYVNSGACYGVAEHYPTTEEEPTNPQYPYALTKLMGEQMVMHWANVYAFPALSIRLFNLYGPRCSALFGLFMDQMRKGKPLTLTGDGSQTRDFTYITDVVSAIIAALKSDKRGKIYNIGSGTTVPVKKVAEMLGAKIEFIPRRAGEMEVTYGDISRARADLDWRPAVSIEKGVSLMLNELTKESR